MIRAGKPGQSVDARLYQVRAASGLNEAVGGEGGFLLQNSYSYDLINAGLAEAELAPRGNPFPIGQNSKSIDPLRGRDLAGQRLEVRRNPAVLGRRSRGAHQKQTEVRKTCIWNRRSSPA